MESDSLCSDHKCPIGHCFENGVQEHDEVVID